VYKKFLPMIFGQTPIQFTKALAKKFRTTQVGVMGPISRKPTNGSYRSEMRMLSALSSLNKFAREYPDAQSALEHWYQAMKAHWFANFAQLWGSRAPIGREQDGVQYQRQQTSPHCHNLL